MLSLLATALVVAVIGVGLAWPLVARLDLAPAEKFIASVALSLLGVYLVAWTVYVCVLPVSVTWILPVLALGGIAFRWAEFTDATRAAVVRSLVVTQALVAAWCLVWLMTIVSYSGGGWAGDWYEHWERTRFFLERWPLDTKFIAQYALTARPPLANVITAAFLQLTRADYVHYQLVTMLLSVVAFLPAALLALRWGGPRAVAVLGALAMVNPCFVQNATFAWTKLPAAFFLLTALYFFLRAHDATPPKSAPTLCAASLAAAILTHYSAGPYCVVLAVAWVMLCRAQVGACTPATTARMALVGAALLATWFAWAFAAYGFSGTLLTNSSVTSADARQGNQLVKMTLNLFDTLVPHFLRPLDTSLVSQLGPWGRLRDWFFQCYQINLPLAFGSVGWLVLGRELLRSAPRANRREVFFWAWFITGVVVLGTVSHGQRDHWGLAHICLQALIVLGLAWLAARWTGLHRAWRIALVAGGVFDLVFGIVLHFGVQSFALERWSTPGKTLQQIFDASAVPAQMNLLGKLKHQLVFLADMLSPPFPLVLAVAGLLLVLAIFRARVNPSSGAGSSLGSPSLPPAP